MDRLVETIEKVDGSGNIEIWLDTKSESFYTVENGKKGTPQRIETISHSGVFNEVKEWATTKANQIMLTE